MSKIQARQKMTKMIGIVALSLAFIVTATIGMVAYLKSKNNGINPLQLSSRQETFREIYSGYKADIQSSFEKAREENRISNKSEQESSELLDYDTLFDRYDQNFFDVLYLMMDSGVEPIELLDYLTSYFGEYEKVVFTQSIEKIYKIANGEMDWLDDSSMSDMQSRDWFAGISISSYDCEKMYRFIEDIRYTMSGNWGTTANFIIQSYKILMEYPLFNSIVTGVVDAIKTIASGIPVIGWIALALVVAAEIGLVVAMYVNGSHHNGFRVGFEVRTGWFGIPIGVSWVCG
ncbi:MAG: hypothetical protein FWF56_01695 [Firmicutes bacterium]|nr:hypothetical protein [Bacillota bacterium]